MRRTRTDDEEPPPAKKQFRAQSDTTPSALPGALRLHGLRFHQFEAFEANARLDAALSTLNRSLFDFIPMDAIVEEADEEEGSDVELEPEPAAPVRPLPGHPPPAEPPEPPSTKRLRHSYSIKTKFKILDCLDKAEAVVKASLAADSPFFHSPVLEGVSRKTGVPISTLKDWVQKRDVIHEKYASKRARRRRRLGSGRLPSFPKAEEAVAKLVNDRRRECRIVSKSFVLKHLKIEARRRPRRSLLKPSSALTWFPLS